MRMGWTVWTTRDGRTSHSSHTLPAVANELSIRATSALLIPEVIGKEQKPAALDQPRTTQTWRMFPSLFFTSLFIYLFIPGVNPFQKRKKESFRQRLILHCSPGRSELWSVTAYWPFNDRRFTSDLLCFDVCPSCQTLQTPLKKLDISWCIFDEAFLWFLCLCGGDAAF